MVGREFETFKSFADVGKKAGLRQFTVGDDVDAAFDLFAYAFGDSAAQRLLEGSMVVGLTGIFRLHHVQQTMRPRQAADMRGLNAVGILL